MSNKKNAVYFKSLTIENVKCFRDEQTIDFTNKNGEPAKWTVILGNNNTGKTTILKCLEILEPANEGNSKDNIFLFPKGYTKDFPTDKMEFQWYDIECKLLFYSNNKFEDLENEEDWFISNDREGGTSSTSKMEELSHFIIYEYGISRNIIINYNHPNSNQTLLVEEWLIQTDYAAKNGAKKAEYRLMKIKEVLKDILPDVIDFKFITNEETFESHVEFQTDYGWMRIKDLGYGYQFISTWVIDLAKKMFDRYPNSENPLHEPAIVLVDEIDLHLHPEWQRKIISYLSDNFPNTQFIVTSHSPLVVQSADEVNVVLLKKEGDKVVIEQPEIENYQGWSVEEILQEVMDLEDRTHSQKYIELRQNFEDALDENDYEKAKNAKDALEKILNPQSTQAKIMEIQMASLTAQFIEN